MSNFCSLQILETKSPIKGDCIIESDDSDSDDEGPLFALPPPRSHQRKNLSPPASPVRDIINDYLDEESDLPRVGEMINKALNTVEKVTNVSYMSNIYIYVGLNVS